MKPRLSMVTHGRSPNHADISRALVLFARARGGAAEAHDHILEGRACVDLLAELDEVRSLLRRAALLLALEELESRMTNRTGDPRSGRAFRREIESLLSAIRTPPRS